ncbi:MAG: hypothetical protein ACO35E_04140 [Ilumatobacteraceae bacterium]|jgi:hypothetical protein
MAVRRGSAEASCLGCGGSIRLEAGVVPDGVIARGDRFMHAGCVLDTAADAHPYRADVPAYHLPEGR